MIVYIMVGPPCSGKSTLAKILAAESNTIRINRDDLRSMTKGRYVFGDRKVESIINTITIRAVEHCVKNRIDVILDATHCKLKYIQEIKDELSFYSTHNIQIKYVVCDEPLWKLKIRNIWRYIKTGIWIPVDVIKSMYKSFQEVKDKINNNEI